MLLIAERDHPEVYAPADLRCQEILPGHQQVRTHRLGAAGHTEIHYVWRDGHLGSAARRLISVGEALSRTVRLSPLR